MIREVEYFESPGPENTARCLEIAAKLVAEGYENCVVASTSGDTGVKAAEILKGTGSNLVVVGHSVGFKGINQDEFLPENTSRINELGGRICRASILTHSLETAITSVHKGSLPTHIIAFALRRVGEGIKVGCEIVMMASDAGLIPEDREVIAVAGTGRGADTVSLIRSRVSKRFLELKVLEILAKPRG